MGNLKEIRTRISSIESTQKITSSMKLVSAAKLRRAQTAIQYLRPYSEKLNEILHNLSDSATTTEGLPLFEQRTPEKIMLVVITSNKGLCGAFNSNVLKLAQQRIDHFRAEKAAIRLITIGKKATELLSRQKDLQLESHDELLDNPSFDAVATLAENLMSDFAEKRVDRVEIIYNQFKNSLSQVLSCEQWLPVESGGMKADGGKSKGTRDYIFEPSKEEILREMIPLTLRSTFYRVVLDSLAAEHGARMTAMHIASDNHPSQMRLSRLSAAPKP